MTLTRSLHCIDELNAGARVLMLAPHPDDETLAAGGLLHCAGRNGCVVKVIFVTDGDNNPWPQRVAERRWFLGEDSRARLGARRRSEAVRALRILGIAGDQVEFWAYPDQGITGLLSAGIENADLLSQLIGTLRDFRPSVVIAPSRLDLHPDHNALGLLIHMALTHIPGPKPLCLHYIVHGRGSAVRAGDFVAAPSSPASRRLKRMAMSEHQSQLVLSRKRFMAYADRREYFIRNDASVADEVWLYAATDQPTYITAPHHWPTLGARVQLLDARGRRCVRRVLAAPPLFSFRKAGIGGVSAAVARDSRMMITVEKGTDVRWLKSASPWGIWDRSGWLQVKPAPRTASGRRHVCCVIPCYNVARFCGAVVTEAARHAETVIAIDDGSTDGTHDVLVRLSEQHDNVRVLVHPCNRGKGAALLSAFAYALEEVDFDVLVSLDSDAQHRACDIVPLVQALRASHAALAIGMRDRFAAMPLRSRIGNEFMGNALRWAFPAAPEDTQSGFRAHTRQFVAFLVEHLDGRRYETELQILAHALTQGPVATIVIPTVYQDNNSSSHFKPLRDSVRVLSALGKLWFNELRSQRRA